MKKAVCIICFFLTLITMSACGNTNEPENKVNQQEDKEAQSEDPENTEQKTKKKKQEETRDNIQVPDSDKYNFSEI